MSGLNVVDSSGWIEFLIGSERADLYMDALMDPENLIVPVISVYEVVKRIRRDGKKEDERIALHAMIQGHVVDLNPSLALDATRYNLPLANSILYTTAERYNATLWTQDQHFVNLPNVRYFPK